MNFARKRKPQKLVLISRSIALTQILPQKFAWNRIQSPFFPRGIPFLKGQSMGIKTTKGHPCTLKAILFHQYPEKVNWLLKEETQSSNFPG